jgi:predicted ATPase
MELLEREQFLDELEAKLSDVAAGNGRFVLVSGEAGIERTSLSSGSLKRIRSWRTSSGALAMRCLRRAPLGPLYDVAHQTESKLLACSMSRLPARQSLLPFSMSRKKNACQQKNSHHVHRADEATLDRCEPT